MSHPCQAVPGRPLSLVGCGILHKEIDFLIKKNAWAIETHFLDSSLHNYLNKLGIELNTALKGEADRGYQSIVFYGACHPRIEDFLTQHHTVRTEGQNCIAMLLGYEQFMQELGKGAYFLLEDWALTWEPMITQAFGKNNKVVQEIFHSSHKYIAAVRTPTSTDFTAAAEAAARFVDLPLVWMDASLDHLELILADAMARKESEEM
jgi:hypothetical protein